MIVVIARLVIRPGSIPHLLGPAKLYVETTRGEEGCLMFDLFTSTTEAGGLVFVEKWETREALSRHSKQPHVAAWREAGKPYVIERVIEVITPEKVETHRV
jgi:quinol monooxygenase YgiN